MTDEHNGHDGGTGMTQLERDEALEQALDAMGHASALLLSAVTARLNDGGRSILQAVRGGATILTTVEGPSGRMSVHLRTGATDLPVFSYTPPPVEANVVPFNGRTH